MQLRHIKLFEKKTGAEKTNKVALRHASSVILFLIIALFVAFGTDDIMSAVSILMPLLMIEIIYGFYMNLSLRLRKLEEQEEMKGAKK